MRFPLSAIFVLAASIIWLVVAIVGIADRPFDHELEWIAVGLGVFGLSFLVPE